jgi:hypothetical protein
MDSWKEASHFCSLMESYIRRLFAENMNPLLQRFLREHQSLSSQIRII